MRGTADEPDEALLVFDIGKTHVKATLLDADGHILAKRRAANAVIRTGPYDHADADGIWDWLRRHIKDLAADRPITKIVIATHGAAAALVDPVDNALIAPIMDYEWDGYDRAAYDRLRPPFAQTGSPDLPAGLNLGRQLHHQIGMLDRVPPVILPYPNYWAWRLTGKVSAEVTSLGCHTDLWDLAAGAPSNLWTRLGAASALPPLHPAWSPLGAVSPRLADDLGLPQTCQVWPGIHDSNAGLVPYLGQARDERPAVISTGTWTIAMASGVPLSDLDPTRDMLANVDACGDAVATARAMGGREFAAICEMLDTDIAAECEAKDIGHAIDTGLMALPSFAPGTGPYPNRTGSAPSYAPNGKAIATLYAALMTDQLLGMLGNPAGVIVEGSFANNALLCSLLSGLSPDRTVHRDANGGLIAGCRALTRWGAPSVAPTQRLADPLRLPGLDAYAARWRTDAKERLDR